MNAELSRILASQDAWARQQELEVDGSRHAPGVEANLYRALSPEATEALASSLAHPLGDPALRVGGAKPCDLSLLESKHALVCNVFDALRDHVGVLAAACGGDPETRQMRLCARVDDEPDGPACELDVLFETGETPAATLERPTAVVASFAEPYASARPFREPANRISSRWLERASLWDALPMCRQLALDLRATPRRFEQLGVAALLVSGASLATRFGYRGSRLVHVWYDAGGASAAAYRRELDRFRFRVGAELDFRAMTWQQLYAKLARANVDAAHLQFLQARYALG